MADIDQDIDHAVEQIDKEESRGSLALWFGVLGSPLAWALHLGVNYSLEEWFACSPSSPEPGKIFGVGVETVSILVNTVFALLALASLLVAFRCRWKLKGQDGDERVDRARWMAFAGVVEGALFLGIILLGYLPAITLEPCEMVP